MVETYEKMSAEELTKEVFQTTAQNTNVRGRNNVEMSAAERGIPEEEVGELIQDRSSTRISTTSLSFICRQKPSTEESFDTFKSL